MATLLSGPGAQAEVRFEDYPATARLQDGSPLVLPDFAGRDAWARRFRTRIREGLAEGPNFAGHYSLIQIGCGTSCSFAYIVDHATGEILPFPYGQERQAMSLSRNVDSRLVKVSWTQGERTCVEHDLVWDGERFALVEQTTYLMRDFACDR
jgi:hypothetical protein